MQHVGKILRKKWVLAAIAAVVVGSGAYAFAATLTVKTATLGAGSKAVTSCAAEADATYTTAYDSTVTNGYRVNTIVLALPSLTCAAGDLLSVTLSDGSSASLVTKPILLTSGEVTAAAVTLTYNSGGTTSDNTSLQFSEKVPVSSVSTVSVSAVGAVAA
ncbi:MAG TPA: hypothetical protein VG652_03110 [Gaiellaceae bacterium]|nr:hypothetical protein [Gaiellaceae bacterium]